MNCKNCGVAQYKTVDYYMSIMDIGYPICSTCKTCIECGHYECSCVRCYGCLELLNICRCDEPYLHMTDDIIVEDGNFIRDDQAINGLSCEINKIDIHKDPQIDELVDDLDYFTMA